MSAARKHQMTIIGRASSIHTKSSSRDARTREKGRGSVRSCLGSGLSVAPFSKAREQRGITFLERPTSLAILVYRPMRSARWPRSPPRCPAVVLDPASQWHGLAQHTRSKSWTHGFRIHYINIASEQLPQIHQQSRHDRAGFGLARAPLENPHRFGAGIAARHGTEHPHVVAP